MSSIKLRHPLWLRCILATALLIFACVVLILLKDLPSNLRQQNYESVLLAVVGIGICLVCFKLGLQRLFFMATAVVSQEGVAGWFVTGGLDGVFIKFTKKRVLWLEFIAMTPLNSLELEGSVVKESSTYNLLELQCGEGSIYIYSKLKNYPDFLKFTDQYLPHLKKVLASS